MSHDKTITEGSFNNADIVNSYRLIKPVIVKKPTILSIATLLIIFSCNTNQEKSPISIAPEVVEARGYKVPRDSVAEPKVIPAGKPTVVRVGKPTIVLPITNVHPVGVPKVVKAGALRVCTPGQDSFSLPKSVPAIDRPFIAGIPEVVIAKEAYTKDQNPQNFSSFSKLQGLKSDIITCLLEDKSGNLWIGTAYGVSKYDGKSFTNFTTKEGLSHNAVTSMLQDTRGNLWFGTQLGGVSRYDGKRFTHFTVKEGLSHNWVTSILQDRSGNIWFGTVEGVNRYDGRSFTHFTENEGLSNNNVTSILEDKSGNLWLGTQRGGVSKYDPAKKKSFAHFTVEEGLSNNYVSSIVEDNSGNLWFGTHGGGVSRYDPAERSFTHFTEKEGLNHNWIMTILKDQSGNLWFGGGGVSKFDGRTFTNFAEKEGLSEGKVKSILQDKHGNLWFGTDGGGVNKSGGKRFTHFTVKEGLSDNRVMNILEDKSGNLWFGMGGKGVSKYDGKSFTNFTHEEGFHFVWYSLKSKSGHFWFGSFWGIGEYDPDEDGTGSKSFTRIEGKEINGNPIDVKCMMEDKSGNLWLGTHNSGVIKYDGKNFTQFTVNEGLSDNKVRSIEEDKDGNLWFGTFDGGVSKYDPAEKSFTHFTEKEGLGGNRVLSILADKSGNLWIGSLHGGVTKYDGKTFTHFTEKEGLSNNDVRSIMEDKNGNLWFGTSAGFSKLEKDKLSALAKATGAKAASILGDTGPLFKTYTYEDGFSGIDVRTGKTMHEAKDGTIWIGAGDRLTAFHPAEDIPDTIPPNIQLTGLTLFNENIAWQNLEKKMDTSIVLGNGVRVHDFRFDSVGKWYGIPEHLSLAYNDNSLTFQFAGITLQSPRNVKYKFKLEGLDENWSALTNRSEANYGNIPHGKYTFKVKAMNGDGYWSKEYTYSFTIRPPWWRTLWAYAVFALLFAGIIYALFRYRLNQIRLQHEQKHKAAELEMQALRAQMNPHFIFNCLSSINRFILKNESETASDYITKFSRLIRLILQDSQAAFISLESELESLQLYLDLEVLRFNYHFDYKIKIADDLDVTEIKVPPLIIQPYVENAIWHGLMQARKKGQLEIELFRLNGELCCKITDDGIGRKKSAELKTTAAHKSMGMQITADRIAILHQKKQSDMIKITDLILPDGTAGGTEVFLKIPLLK